jgi:hypothetical protein
MEGASSFVSTEVAQPPIATVAQARAISSLRFIVLPPSREAPGPIALLGISTIVSMTVESIWFRDVIQAFAGLNAARRYWVSEAGRVGPVHQL